MIFPLAIGLGLLGLWLGKRERDSHREIPLEPEPVRHLTAQTGVFEVRVKLSVSGLEKMFANMSSIRRKADRFITQAIANLATECPGQLPQNMRDRHIALQDVSGGYLATTTWTAKRKVLSPQLRACIDRLLRANSDIGSRVQTVEVNFHGS